MHKNEINYSEITPEIRRLSAICEKELIPSELYSQYKVNRGLRDLNGNGVLTGLTNISSVTAKKIVDERFLWRVSSTIGGLM